MAGEIEILGVGTVLEAFTKYATQAQEIAAMEINAAGKVIETRAKERCPVGTPESTHIKGYKGGRLRSSIRPIKVATPGDLETSVGSDVEYALWVEEGTQHMSARPYLHPAFEKTAPQFQRNLERKLTALIENGGGA